MREFTLRQWIEAWDNGDFLSPDFDTQCQAGWYDWFCTETSLMNRLKRMASKVKKIATSTKVNQDTMYVFFKNNCPMWISTTYDDFRICDIASHDVIFTIIPRYPLAVEKISTFNWKCKMVSEVYSAEVNDTVVSGTWKDVLEYFGVK